MKKTLILGMLGVALSATSSFAQGFITLDNYNTGGPNVTYGAGSGGTVGAGLGTGWTVGLYFAPGDILASIPGNAAGNGDVSAMSGSFALGAGAGSTAAFFDTTFGTAGQFFSSAAFQASATSGSTVTLVLVAYNGANYANSAIRGHSAAFTMPTVSGSSPTPSNVGSFMSGFSVTPVPEPTTFALAGLGSAAMLIFRRRK